MKTEKTEKDYILGISMALVAAILWSILPILLKIASERFSSELIVFSRFSVAAILLYFYLVISRKKFLHVPSNIFFTLVAAMALSLNYLTYTLGVKYSGASNAGILIQSGSVFLTFFGIFLFKERLTAKQFYGIILVILGFSLFLYERVQFTADLNNLIFGTLVTLVSGFMWAVYAVMVKLDKKNSSDSAFNLWVFLVGALLFYLKTPNADLHIYSQEEFFLLFFLGLITLLSYSALVVALKHIDAALVSVIVASEIIILLAIIQLMDYFNLKIIKAEPISLIANAGAFIALFGITLIIFKQSEKNETGEESETVL